MDIQLIPEIANNCLQYIEKEDYRSYDPFDALTNPLINYLTSDSEILRRIAIQITSKSIMDLRWSGMQKKTHTKTVSDLLCYYSLREKREIVINENTVTDNVKIKFLYYKLIDLMISGTYSWGLNFPYTSRFTNADSDAPNLYNTVNSGISICHSLKKLDTETKRNATEVLNGIVKYINSAMWTIDEKGQGWYQYYLGQRYPTYNVNALALYFLVLFQKTFGIQDFELENKSKSLIKLLCEDQRPDGSWPYTSSNQGKWIDGFHTGFILESIAFVQKEGKGSPVLADALSKGIDYYIKNLFTKNGYVKYFSNSSKYPVDAQNYAQAIETLSLLGTWGMLKEDTLLESIISKAIRFLYNNKGYFNYKKTRCFTYTIPYFRWSVTPMIIALEYAHQYLSKLNSTDEKIC